MIDERLDDVEDEPFDDASESEIKNDLD